MPGEYNGLFFQQTEKCRIGQGSVSSYTTNSTAGVDILIHAAPTITLLFLLGNFHNWFTQPTYNTMYFQFFQYCNQWKWKLIFHIWAVWSKLISLRGNQNAQREISCGKLAFKKSIYRWFCPCVCQNILGQTTQRCRFPISGLFIALFCSKLDLCALASFRVFGPHQG